MNILFLVTGYTQYSWLQISANEVWVRDALLFYPHFKTVPSQMTQMVNGTQMDNSENPIKPKWTNAELNKPINSRSPRVVVMGKKPFLSVHGDSTSRTVIVNKISAMPKKNSAEGVVQAIQFIILLLKLDPMRNLSQRDFSQTK